MMAVTFFLSPFMGKIPGSQLHRALTTRQALHSLLYVYYFTLILTITLGSYIPSLQMLRECRQFFQGSTGSR